MEAIELAAEDFARFEIEELSQYDVSDVVGLPAMGASTPKSCTSSSTCSSCCG